ncbi:MAG: hypothetical protein EPN43_00495 [Jatrophihabitans sp.]|nr:MAG: hypothetical protein EPN43_00495 [Jatrophihabitans sp.]
MVGAPAALAAPTPGARAAGPLRQAGAPVLPAATGSPGRTIVILRDTAAGLKARSAARAAAVHAQEAPVVSAVRGAGGTVEAAGSQMPFVVASLSDAQRTALAADPQVQAVFPDSLIPAPRPAFPADPLAPAAAGGPAAASGPVCGTKSAPELDPEALGVIHAPQANALGYTGAGVSVAYIAGPVDTTQPDLLRNPAYASSGSPAGSPVVSAVDFTGDPAGTPNPDAAGESFLDAGSIAAQGNAVYDLNSYVNPSHPLPSKHCDITIVGAAPGASVTGLDVFSATHDTTESNFIQAIDYAVGHGVQVLNESFGANNFPDLALDATRLADDAAVAAGVTVVVSSGDAGVTSTIGSPATDPNLISVGATTTFRAYQQLTYGGINATTPNATNGTWIDDNISSLSSGGFAMGGGNTVDLVAPGDLNWTLCSTGAAFAAGCRNDNGTVSPFALSGGTSEAAPLTSAAAADVIDAYAATHGGTYPSPALVKQILMSTARDIDAPAEQQGAGLLDVAAAVREAAALTGATATGNGGLLFGPNQVNITQAPRASTSQTVSVANTGSAPLTVNLSTRALGAVAARAQGSFCLNPSSSASGACGPPTATNFPIWSGVTEVYQEQTFRVPAVAAPARLDFSATYPSDTPPQTSLLHVALYDPTGAYAGYSLPQGQANFADIQVADPAPGTWTAVFFTAQDAPGLTGTSGTIQWQALTSQFAPAGAISPSVLTIPAGGTGTATFTATSPATSGDSAQSIVLQTVGGPTSTIPVTVRTTVPTGRAGGTFSGVLTGGNGRGGTPAQTNTYVFAVPGGLRDLDVSAAFADAGDTVVAFLLDPEGEAVASSSNVTLNSSSQPIGTGAVNVYKDQPEAGTWTLVLDWVSPGSGAELSEPFSGAVAFNRVVAASTMPAGGFALTQGRTYTFAMRIKNTGASPQAFFLDPRTSDTRTVLLPDLNGSDQNMSLPLPPGLSFPVYLMPPDTSGLTATLSGSAAVTFDVQPFTGDPDLSPALPAPGVIGSQGAGGASLSFTTAGELMPGYWLLNPSEFGPYGAAGAPAVTASATFSALTLGFDPTVSSATGDLWSVVDGPGGALAPLYLLPGQSATIPFQITPSAAPGSVVSGSVRVDDTFLNDVAVGGTFTGGDELASVPYTYVVAGGHHG